jgi:hypothetical protein
MPISSQNRTLAATQVPPRFRCLSSPPPLFQSPPFKLNPVPVVRNQGPNHRRKNHIKSRSVASTIYRRRLTVVSRRGCDFSGELEVNPTSSVSSPYRTLAPGLYESEIGGYSSSYSKFRRTSGEVPASKLHCCLLPSTPTKLYKYLPV